MLHILRIGQAYLDIVPISQRPGLVSGDEWLYEIGGSTISGSVVTLKRCYPALEWKEGCLLNRVDEKTIRTWIDRLGY